MAEGIHEVGGAHMGALRAAELADFRMQGVGAIFEMDRDGRLVANDEVALVHGPADTGYRAITEPLVNIRFTVARAVASGTIASDLGSELIEIARALFYKAPS